MLNVRVIASCGRTMPAQEAALAMLLLTPVASAAGVLLNSAVARRDAIAAVVGTLALLALLAMLAFVATVVRRVWSIRQDLGVLYVAGPEPHMPHQKQRSEGRLKRWLRMTEVSCALPCTAAWHATACVGSCKDHRVCSTLLCGSHFDPCKPLVFVRASPAWHVLLCVASLHAAACQPPAPRSAQTGWPLAAAPPLRGRAAG